ncbi:MAG: tetratricopeptide repeat protein [Ignavibacteriaceae bacterium]|jgi:tetratricopeptide (TPR) repeat protein
MKFKLSPVVIYPAIMVVAAAIIIIFSTDFSSKKSAEPTAKAGPIVSDKLPNDDIHKNMGKEIPPSKENVISDIKKKMETLKAEVEKNPNDTAKVRQYADLLAEGHGQADAVKYYEMILKKDPKRVDILQSLGYIFYVQQDLNKAEAYIAKAYSLDKNNFQALFNLGAIAATKGDNEKAKKIWKEIIAKHPNTEVAKLAQDGLKQLQ